MNLLGFCGLWAALLAATPVLADDFDMSLVGRPEIVRPAAAPTGAVALFSGTSGWGAAEAALADALAARGALVIGIETPATLGRIAGAADDCVWVIGEIEAVSHAAQRELGAADYHFPALAGIGAGAAFALAVAAQTEEATIARVVAVDPAAAPTTGKPLCMPASAAPGSAPFPVSIVLTPSAHRGERLRAASLAKGRPEVTVRETAAAPSDALFAALAPPPVAAGDALSDLPLEELPTATPADAFAVLYSGDGGWRDLDKEVAAILRKDGLPVVGVDSLRYFWTRKSPETVAADLDRIVRAYRAKWGAKRVALIGYSFGADILPIAVNRLSADVRAAVAQVSLLAFSETADLEVTVGSWLDRKGREAMPSLAEARRLDPRRVQCFYGADDADAACAKLAGSGVEVVRTAGGHHFDGDYAALARRIREGLRARSALPPG